MRKQRKRWMAVVLSILMLVISIGADTGLTANAATKKAGAISIANLPENNTLRLNPEDDTTYSYDFNAKKDGAGVVYFEVKKDTNTTGVNSSKNGIVYPATAGSFEIRAVAFASAANRAKWLDARKANGYVADPEAEKYIVAASEWTTITVTTDKVNEGLGVARNQSSLDKILKNKNVKNVVIWTNAERNFTIAGKNYKSKTLTVKAPNAEITNAGRFAQINVEQIKTSTFTERAKGNRFHVSALNARIIVERGARILGLIYQPNIKNTDITVSTSFNFNLVVHGSVDLFHIAPQRDADVTSAKKPVVKIEADVNSNLSEVKISETSDVTIAGEKEMPVNVTVEESAAGTDLTAETPIKADLSADTSITLAENAKKSELTVSKKADVEVRAAEADKPVEDITVKVAKEAEGAKVSLFVKVVVEISANITLAGTAAEESSVIVMDKDIKVMDEDGNVIETDNADSENQGIIGGDSTVPDTPSIPVTPVPTIPEFSGKVIWSVGSSDSGTISKDSQNPITIPLSAEAVSGSAIDFSLYAGDKSKYTVSADKSHLEGAETKVKVTVKSIDEPERIVAEYMILFTIELTTEDPSKPENLPVLEIKNNEYNPVTADFDSVTISEMKETGTNEYEITITIPEIRKFGEFSYSISAKGYTTVGSSWSIQTFNGANGPELIFPYHSELLKGEGKPDISVKIYIEFEKLSPDSPEWDVQTYPTLQGTLMVSGSAVTVSGSALIMRVGMYDNEEQEMQFTTNDDGSITGEFVIKIHRAAQKLRVSFQTDVKSNEEVEYIWERDGKVIINDLIDMQKLEDVDSEGYQIITYSITIKAK